MPQLQGPPEDPLNLQEEFQKGPGPSQDTINQGDCRTDTKKSPKALR